MKHIPLLLPAGLLALPLAASAHPGHFAFDWFSAPPHPGHESEYAIVLTIGIVAAICGVCSWISRKR